MSKQQNLTILDIKLAKIYFPLLIELALHKHTLTYGELVEKAKQMHPDLDYVQNAFPLSIGRRLNAVWYYTEERELPDLTTLLISKADGEKKAEESERQRVFDYDWASVDQRFDVYADELSQTLKPRKTIKRDEAKGLMSEHYYANKQQYSSTIANHREEIIGLIMEGIDVAEAFSSVDGLL